MRGGRMRRRAKGGGVEERKRERGALGGKKE